MKLLKLCVLVDSCNYALNEIYQSQLWETAMVDDTFEVSFIESNDFTRNHSRDIIESSDVIYCAMKIRTAVSFIGQLQDLVQDAGIIVQDYDPWVNFLDNQPHKGCYDTIASKLNVLSFFVSSQTWARRIFEKGYKATFIKLGMLDRHLCGRGHQHRRNSFEFRGSKHQPRVEGHNRLLNAGVKVEWFDSIKPYSAFLDDCSNLFAWCHNENSPVTVDGVSYRTCDSLWPKGVEVLSRGCFLLRDYQTESMYHGFDRFPTAMLFDNEAHAKILYDKLLGLSMKERNQMMFETLSIISNTNYYGKILEQIKEVGMW